MLINIHECVYMYRIDRCFKLVVGASKSFNVSTFNLYPLHAFFLFITISIISVGFFRGQVFILL